MHSSTSERDKNRDTSIGTRGCLKNSTRNYIQRKKAERNRSPFCENYICLNCQKKSETI